MNIPFIFLALACLTVPGWAACTWLNIKENRILHSIAISYSIFFLAFSLCSYFKVIEGTLIITTLATLVASTLLIIIAYAKKRLLINGFEQLPYVIGIFLCALIYNLIMGVASDVPSDIYAHFERFQRVLADLNNEPIDEVMQSRHWLKQGYGWYYFLAAMASTTSATSIDVIESVSVITNTLFFISLFCFSRSLFNDRTAAAIIAIMVCIFTAAHMGVNVFAFARYYTAGPTMIGFCIYFAAIRYFLDGLANYSLPSLAKSAVIVAAYILVGIGNHTQEAMFIVVMCSIMVLTLSFRYLLKRSSLESPSSPFQHVDRRFIYSSAILIVASFCAIYVYTVINSDRAAINDIRLWQTPELFGFLPSFTVVNLSHQFIQVITLWGCLVYLLFFLNYQRYKDNLFVVAGMISPLFTVLNPLFVDLFLHHESFTTLWRLSYLVTIHFVAADLFVHYWQQTRQSQIKKRLISLTIISLLIGLLLPFKNTWQGVHYSRVPTLAKTKTENSYRHYSDLLSFLSAQEKSTIVTDPITGYLIAAMTHHQSPRRKFFRDDKYNNFSFYEYDQNTLKKFKGHLLLINKRAQVISNLGQLSGHWPADQLKQIHYYYPDALIKHVNSNPNSFEQLWTNNGISLYQIN